MRRYRTVDVVLAPAGGQRIRYTIQGVVHCSRMNTRVRNRGTYGVSDLVWIRVFGSRRAAERFLAHGRAITLRMRLSTLGYDPCDFSLR